MMRRQPILLQRHTHDRVVYSYKIISMFQRARYFVYATSFQSSRRRERKAALQLIRLLPTGFTALRVLSFFFFFFFLLFLVNKSVINCRIHLYMYICGRKREGNYLLITI